MMGLVSFGAAIQNLGLALLIGGLLALGAFTAPVLFKQFPRPEAGVAMTTIFRRYDMVILVSTILILLGELFKTISLGFIVPPVLLSGVRFLILIALVTSTFYSTLVINPKMEQLQKSGLALAPHASTESQGRSKAFHQAHLLSEKLAKFQLLLAILLLLFSPFCQSLDGLKVPRVLEQKPLSSRLPG